MTKTRVALPQEISSEMNLWREGLRTFPQKYIEFHKGLAEAELPNLEAAGYKTHKSWMESDGWGDGMRALHVIVEGPNHKLTKLKWHDGNQGFMEQMPSGGCGIFTY